VLTGTYLPGTSALHRARTGRKLLGLVLFSTLLVAWRSPMTVLFCFVVLTAGYTAAGLGLRTLLAQVWPLRWIVLLLAPFQWWTGGWRAAMAMVGTLVLAVAAAGLVSLTTRVTDVLDVTTRILKPARRIGIDPDRVALLLALTIRTVPVIAGTFNEVRDARRARGLERSTRALVTPLVVRTIRHADRVGDALAARGVDD